jgi:hypothetical protein
MNGKEMSKALGISEAMVSRLRKRGMPMDDVARAERWRRRNMAPARMKGARMDIRQAPVAKPAAPRRSDLAAEFERVATSAALDGAFGALPAPVANYLQALLQQMPFAVFQHLYRGKGSRWAVGDAIDRLLPRAFLEWGYAGPEEDTDDVPDVDLPEFQQLVAGLRSFEWSATGRPWPTFRDCIRPRAGELDASAMRYAFEAFVGSR